MQKARFKILRNGRTIGTATFYGRSQKQATAIGRRALNGSGIRPHRNIAAGFYDSSGTFHPIRSSPDYAPKRAGEKPRGRRPSRDRELATAWRRKYKGKRKPAKRPRAKTKRTRRVKR